MKIKGFKIALFLFFGIILILPLIFSFTKLNSKIELKGDVALIEKPKLTAHKWVDGSYQNQFEKYINDHVGFRPIFVRIRNQVQYSLFNEAKAAGVIEGKEKYLYEKNYIKAFNGDDFLGSDTIYQRTQRLKTLQDSLSNFGKTLLVCLAPGKGSFYPEYFPDNLIKPKTDSTNYKRYSYYLNKTGVNFLDFNKWFLEMKDTSQFILYPKYGIHWSYYGMVLATDSLIHHVEKLVNKDLPNLIIGKNNFSRKLKPMDYDIADGMNLLWQLPSPPMCYPETKWEDAAEKSQPKTILIGDSFYWSMFQEGIWKNSFSPGGFWFYNRQIYPDSFTKPLEVKDVNYWQYISNNDLFILLVTEANLPKFSWGFTNTALSAFNNKNFSPFDALRAKALQEELELEKQINSIRSNKKWMEDISKKASKNNIGIDSMLVLDAKWMIDYRKKQQNK